MRSDIFYVHPQDATPAPWPPPAADPAKAWTPRTLRREDYLQAIQKPCLRELEEVVQRQRRDPAPVLELRPEHFALESCRALMAGVKRGLDRGAGFAVLNRFPLERWEPEEAKAAYWLLGLMLGRPYFQASHGEKDQLLFDVMDYGPQPVEPDAPTAPREENYGRLARGSRGDVTNSRLVMHTDFSHAEHPPRYVGLLCLETALEGGETRLVSWHTVLQELLRRRPELAARGFRPFLMHRQNIQAPDQPVIISRPLMTWQDGLRMQYSSRLVRTGYREAGVEMDAETRAFLDTVDEIVQEQDVQVAFHMERGQIQFVTNDECGHERTEYRDRPEPGRRRRMVRLHLLDGDAAVP